jgi:hypothetical protein
MPKTPIAIRPNTLSYLSVSDRYLGIKLVVEEVFPTTARSFLHRIRTLLEVWLEGEP